MKNYHKIVQLCVDPLLTPVLAVQESSFIKTYSGIQYAAFSADVDYFICSA
jgi:hypothetical protein